MKKRRVHVSLLAFTILLLSIGAVITGLQSGRGDYSSSPGFLPHIPGVSGFGQDTRGGKGGKIIIVNNLNREGKGSLAEAISGVLT